jgi:hypothetical protein
MIVPESPLIHAGAASASRALTRRAPAARWVYLLHMDNHTQQIVNKAWSYAHVLRDDGLSYLAYTEQITFLLFLKMADEQT